MTRRLAIGLLAVAAIALFALADIAPEATPGPEPQITESTLVETVEIESGRGATTRIWENVYLEPALDIDGNPTGEVEERRARYTELATGLCYNAAQEGEPADWQPTVTDFVQTGDTAYPFEVTTGPLQVRLSSDPTWGSHVQVTANGETVTLGVAGLVVQDPETGETTLLEEARRVEPVVEGNRILFPGAFSCGDLEYVYHRHGFEQNLIITSREGLPSEGLIGLASALDTSANAPRLAAQGDVAPNARGVSADLGARLSGGEVIRAEDTPLAFVNAEGQSVMRFAPGQAWDAAGQIGANAVSVRQSALESNNRRLLVDAVDAEWLGNAELPVTIDYIVNSDLPTSGNVLFERGETYFINGIYTVTAGHTLAIEPGAVIKLEAYPSAWSAIDIASGAKIQALGQELDPIIFTVANNDDVGEIISGAGAGESRRAVRFTSSFGSASDTADSEFAHVRFSSIATPIEIVGGCYLEENADGDPSFRHCIFRECGACIFVSSLAYNSQINVFNCAFLRGDPTDYGGTVDNSYATVFSLTDGPTIDVTLTNCTSHGMRHLGAFFRAAGTGGTVNLNVTNTLITHAEQIFYDSVDSTFNDSVDYNAEYDTDSWCNTADIAAGANTKDLDSLTGSSPYVNSSAGDFYTNGTYLSNAGTGTSLGLGLDTMIISAPVEINATPPPGTWWEAHTYSTDSGTVDIGYHYPRVDYVIDAMTIPITNTLIIEDGTRIAFEAGGGKLSVVSGGAIVRQYDSTGGEPIGLAEMFSTNVSGDAVDDGKAGDYGGIVITSSAPRTSDLRFLRMRHAAQAIAIGGDRLFEPIANCQFIDCDEGVVLGNLSIGEATAGDVMNCLFLRNLVAATLGVNDMVTTPFDYAVEGNTFYQCDHGLLLMDIDGRGTGAGPPVSLVHEDNLYVACENAITASNSLETAAADIAVVDRNNVWYANIVNIQDDSQYDIFTTDDKIDPTGTGRHNITENPLLAHITPASSLRWESEDFSHDDGFFLTQNAGDVSRWPFEVPDDHVVCDAFGIEIPVASPLFGEEVTIRIGVAKTSCLPVAWDLEYLGYYESSVAVPGNQQVPDDGSRLWVRIQGASKDITTIPAGSYFNIHLIENANPDPEITTLRVYLPAISLDDDAWCGWVAVDGSTYHANSSHPSTGGFDFDQCSGYAMAVDPNGLAQSPRGASSSNTSPLIDAGSRDFFNSGFTSTSTDAGGDLDEPDNPDISTTTPGGSDSEDQMDIGYHHKGSLRHPVVTQSTTQSGYWIPARTGNPNTITQELLLVDGTSVNDIDQPQSVALISRMMNSTDNRVGETNAYLGAQTYDPDPAASDDSVLPLLRWQFNDNSLEPVILNTLSTGGQRGIENRPRGTGSGSEYTYVIEYGGNASTWGVITGTCVVDAVGRESTGGLGYQYLATVVTWTETIGTQDPFDELYIWRSDDTDGGAEWDLIGTRLHPWATNTVDWCNASTRINRVSLICNGDDLWVFWIQDMTSTGLYGVHIPDAATRTRGYFTGTTVGVANVFNFSLDGPVGQAVTTPILTSSQADINDLTASLDAVFDFAYGGSSNPNDGCPVIIYNNQNDLASVARIELNTTAPSVPTDPPIGAIVGIGSDYPVTLASDDSEDLAITANHWAEDYPSGEDTIGLHAAYRQTVTSSNVYSHTATRDPNDSPPDTWSSASGLEVPTIQLATDLAMRNNVDVTWRFNGRPRHVLAVHSDRSSGPDWATVTDTELLVDTNYGSKLNNITTNAENLTDIWTLTRLGAELAIMRIDP